MYVLSHLQSANCTTTVCPSSTQTSIPSPSQRQVGVIPDKTHPTIEAMVGWVEEWLERIDYRYKYMGHTSQMKRPASEYFARNIWVNGDPEEKMFPLIVQFAGDDRFFIGSDYPHAEGFVHPVEKARNVLSTLPPASVDKILGTNAANFYRI